MRLKNNSWAFQEALSKDQCQQLIDYGNQQVSQIATTGGGKITSSKIRKSEVAWLYDPWIMELLEDYVRKANYYAGWNFQYESAQQIQFTKYKVGGHYQWHRDTNVNTDLTGGRVRKLSITVNLNNDYEGGDLEIDTEKHYWNKEPMTIKNIQKAGSICVFPSDTWHRVTKVTKGTRYSLVVWLMGDPWK